MSNSFLLHVCERASEWKGRVIAYCGGGGVSLFSHEAAAQTAQTVHEVTYANWISLGGLLVIVCRLAFDVYVHFEKKRMKRESKAWTQNS